MLTINKRSLARIVAPVTEPLSLAETKLYLRIDGMEEDALITDMISVAREYAEHYLKKSLLMQSWKLTLEDYAPEAFRLPFGPIQSVTSVTLIDQNSEETIFSAENYTLQQDSDMLRFTTTPYAPLIAIDYVAGYEDVGDIPRSIRYGMFSHIAAMYDNRGEAAIPMPSDARALYTPHREVVL